MKTVRYHCAFTPQYWFKHTASVYMYNVRVSKNVVCTQTTQSSCYISPSESLSLSLFFSRSIFFFSCKHTLSSFRLTAIILCDNNKFYLAISHFIAQNSQRKVQLIASLLRIVFLSYLNGKSLYMYIYFNGHEAVFIGYASILW